MSNPSSSDSRDEVKQPFFNDVPSENEKQRQRQPPLSIFAELQWWQPEIIASMFSVASLLSIVLVLRMYDGRNASELRLPSTLTLNGLIAAIATINRACLTTPLCSAVMQEMWIFFAKQSVKAQSRSRLLHMDLFSKASMGTWGSLTFLFRAPSSSSLASVGCILIIVSLAYSTFTQQLLGLDLAPVTHLQSPVNIPRSETWSRWGGTAFDAISSFDPGQEVIAALYSGVLTDNIANIETPCRTGNCSWPSSPSMAVCGACEDSSLQRLSCPSQGSCDYVLPSQTVTSLYNFQNISDDSGQRNKGTNSTSPARNSPIFRAVPGNGAIFNASRQDRLYIMNVDLVGAGYWSFFDKSPALSNTECALWMCVQAYETSVNSTLQHQEITWSRAAIDSDYGKLTVPGGAFQGNTYYTFPDIPTSPGSTGNVNFTVGLWAHLALQQYMYSAMQGTVHNDTSPFSNDLTRGIWKGTQDPHVWINNIARSISNVVRSTDTSHRPEFNGTELDLTVKVRWEWLVLPAALVVFSILLLLVVIVRTTRSEVRAWKGSPLTLLLFDVDRETRDLAHGTVETHRGLEKAVGRRRVKLTRSEGGMRRLCAT